MSIVYDINFWPYTQDADFTLGNYLFRAVKLTKNANFNKYSYSGYDIGFDTHVTKNQMIQQKKLNKFQQKIIFFSCDEIGRILFTCDDGLQNMFFLSTNI